MFASLGCTIDANKGRHGAALEDPGPVRTGTWVETDGWTEHGFMERRTRGSKPAPHLDPQELGGRHGHPLEVNGHPESVLLVAFI